MNDETNSESTDRMDEWAEAMAEAEQSDGSAAAAGESAADQAIERAQFQDLQPEAVASQGEVNLDVVLDVPVTLAMEIGRTRISIRNLLQLNQGSVVELDRLAGEPMDVLVNGTLIAHGEVVVVNEKFGIRLTDVVSPSERVKRLT